MIPLEKIVLNNTKLTNTPPAMLAEIMPKMARLIQTTIFVKNGPSYSGIGVGGEGHTTFTIAGPTGEGLTSAKTFTRKRRCVLVEGFNVR